MNKLKKFFYGGDWLLAMSVGILFLLFLMIITQEQKPERPPKIQEITLEDGTKCVVLKGFSSDNSIECEWSK